MPESAIWIEVEGFKPLIDRVNRAGDTGARISINEGLRRIGRLVVPSTGTGPLADETPRVSGKLARSTVFQVIGGPMAQALEIRQSARSPLGVFYGFIVREGRGPVEAKRAKALHFFIDGQEFFRQRVGPAAPNPYHIRVLNRLMPQIQAIVTAMGERLAAFISGAGSLGQGG
jgi:hypothetical protein